MAGTYGEYAGRPATVRRIRGVRLGTTALAALLTVALGGCAKAPSTGAAAPKGATVLNYGVTTKSLSSIPLLVGEAKGFFSEAGLKLDVAVVGQSGKVCQQVIAHALDVGECSTSDAIQAIASGGKITIPFFMSQSVLPNRVYANPGITKWSQLKGKTVMVAGPRDNTLYFTRLMAAAGGLNLKNVTLQYAGSSTDRFAALKSGAVDATILTTPFDFQAKTAGYTELDDLTKHLSAKQYAGNGVVVGTQWAAKNQGVLKKLYSAMEKSLAFSLDPKNKADVISILEKEAGVDAATANWGYTNLLVSGYFFTGGKANASGLNGIVSSLKSLGFLSQGTVPSSTEISDSSLVLGSS
jgi:NitT/TauT family transport system substrate-binding protein